MPNILDVTLHNLLAGQLTQDDAGRLSFAYDPAYLDHPQARPLSVTMPLASSPYPDPIARPFFSGLLPDDMMRQKIAQCLGVSKKNPQALLKAIGGECAGAVSLFVPGTERELTQANEVVMLRDEQVQELLGLLSQQPLLVTEKDMRLSLAGAQEKLAVGLKDNQICLMKGTLPTTHILKPPIEDFDDTVYNEYFCMRLAKKARLPVPSVSIKHLGQTPVLLVERYDRLQASGRTVRLHQEDFCQASSIAPEMKYEREGGPSISDAQTLIAHYSQYPAVDQKDFLRRVIFNYLIGNADAHGKNFSFLHTKSGQKLSPAYDLLSTSVYPALTPKMAMKIGGKYLPKDVYARHWETLQPPNASAQQFLKKQLLDMSQRLPLLAKQLQSAEPFPPVVAQIVRLIEVRAQWIQARLNNNEE